jgi:hypothetical protein
MFRYRKYLGREGGKEEGGGDYRGERTIGGRMEIWGMRWVSPVELVLQEYLYLVLF